MARWGILTAKGMGDGILFLSAASHLQRLGHSVTLYNDHLPSLQSWLPSLSLQPTHTLQPFDYLLLQHDNSPTAYSFPQSPNLYRFYGSHQESKHGPLHPQNDFVANFSLSMAQNISLAMEKWTKAPSSSPTWTIPPHLSHQKYKNRIILHSSSGSCRRNWPLAHFQWIAKKWESMGYECIFISDEQGNPMLPSLSALASLLFEASFFLGNDSGPAHLASALQIPVGIVASHAMDRTLWTPTWSPTQVFLPPRWSRKWKRGWKFLVRKNRVFKEITLQKQGLLYNKGRCT